MDVQPIASADDPRIAAYRHIKERDLRGRDGLFMAEGEVVLRVLVRASHHRCRSVLIDGRRLEKLRPILADLPEGTPIYVTEREVIDAIAGFPLHRGILALGEPAPALSAEMVLASAPARAVVLVLYGIANHDNLGGLFRNAAAFGAHAVLLDETCCDPLYRKAIRVSVGAALRVPFARWAGAAEELERHGFQPVALSPGGECDLGDFTPPTRTALMLGAEGPGLPPELMALARSVRIPMAAGWDSLNVATTAGIVLHRLATQRG